MKELFIRLTARAFRKLLSIYVFSYFPFGFEGRTWDLIVTVPDHCLSFYFLIFLLSRLKTIWRDTNITLASNAKDCRDKVVLTVILTVPRRYFCCGSLLLLVLAVRIYNLVYLLC